MEIQFTDDDDDDDDEIIESSQVSEDNCKILPLEPQRKSDEINLPDNHENIAEIMRVISGDIECVSSTETMSNKRKETVITIDDDIPDTVCVNENVENDVTNNLVKTSYGKSKITDYFCKMDKPK